MSLIKTQIVKILSKFLKNVSSEQIDLSVFKGRCELSNVDLDEKIVSIVLGLPCWLTIEAAKCSKVRVDIPWMHIRSSPMIVTLCRVEVNIETSTYKSNSEVDQRTAKAATDALSLMSGAGGYGLPQKIVENARVIIDNLIVSYKSSLLKMRTEIPSFVSESCMPTGLDLPTDSISLSRVQNSKKGETLIFKRGYSPVMKLESFANDGSDRTLLKLIANTVEMYTIIKRQTDTGQLLGIKMSVKIGQFLTVVSSHQLKASLASIVEVMDLMFKSFQDTQSTMQSTPLPAVGFLYRSDDDRTNIIETGLKHKKSDKFSFGYNDIFETSFHLSLEKIDLHMISDELPKLEKILPDASVLLTIEDIKIDHYPCHRRGAPRPSRAESAEIAYHPFNQQRLKWSEQILVEERVSTHSLIEYSIYISVETIRIGNLVDGKLRSKTSINEAPVLETGSASFGAMPCLEVDFTYITTKAAMNAALKHNQNDGLVKYPQVPTLMINCSRQWKVYFCENSLQWITGFLMSSIPDQIFDLFTQWSILTEGVTQSSNFPYTCLKTQIFEIVFPNSVDNANESCLYLSFCGIELSNCLMRNKIPETVFVEVESEQFALWNISIHHTQLHYHQLQSNKDWLVWPCPVILTVRIPVFGSVSVPNAFGESIIEIKVSAYFVNDLERPQVPYSIIQSAEQYNSMIHLKVGAAVTVNQMIAMGMKLYEQEAASTDSAAQIFHSCRITIDANIHSYVLVFRNENALTTSDQYALTIKSIKALLEFNQKSFCSPSGDHVSGFFLHSDLKFKSCRSEPYRTLDEIVKRTENPESQNEPITDPSCIMVKYSYDPLILTINSEEYGHILVSIIKLTVQVHYGLLFFASSLFATETNSSSAQIFKIPIRLNIAEVKFTLVDDFGNPWPIDFRGVSLIRKTRLNSIQKVATDATTAVTLSGFRWTRSLSDSVLVRTTRDESILQQRTGSLEYTNLVKENERLKLEIELLRQKVRRS